MASCIYLIPKQLSSWRCQGMDCPYLGTINRRKRCLLSLLFLWGLDWLIRTEANLFIWFSRIISFENGRHVLDFDFEKLCSMTLSGDNVYCDLVDGKFFQGRGKDTPAYRAGLKNSKLTDSLIHWWSNVKILGFHVLRSCLGERSLRLDECSWWQGLLHPWWLWSCW